MILVMKLHIDSFFCKCSENNQRQKLLGSWWWEEGETLSLTEHNPRLGYTVKMKLNLSVMSKVDNVFFVLVMKPLLLGIF